MTVQYSETLANALLEAYESNIGASAILKLYDLSGAAPADCAAAISGTVLAIINLPADWMTTASGGIKTISGTWEDVAADATGTVDFYRLFASDGTTCHEQGTVTATGGGGDMTVDNTSIAISQTITITAFTKSLPV